MMKQVETTRTRNQRRTRWRAALLAGSLALVVGLLAACGADEEPDAASDADAETETAEADEAAPAEGAAGTVEVLTVGMPSDPESMDPHTSATSGTVTAVNHVFDKLVQRNAADMTIEPDLAESWEQVDDITYDFFLREGVTFHNGDDLTASDVVFSFERMRGEGFESLGAYVDPLIESVEATGDYEVRITLVEPYAPFMKRVPTFYIVPQAHIEEVGDAAFAENPVGSGPFKFEEWVQGERLVLTANEDYWRGTPAAQRVEFRPIPEPSTRVSGLLSGDLDVIQGVGLDSVDQVEQADGARILAVDDNRFYFYALNSDEPPFDDARVRRALTYAIDWDEVLALYAGYAQNVRFPSLPNDFGYDAYLAAVEEDLPEYDPDRARELLADAGYEDGFETVVQTAASHWPRDVDLAQAVASQLEQVGIQAEVNANEWGVYLSDVYRGGDGEGLVFFTMGNPLFDPDHLCNVHWAEGRAEYYNDETTRELCDLGRVTTDEDERIAIYTELMEHLVAEAPYVMTHQVQQVYGIRDGLEWQPRADNRVFMDEVTVTE